MPANTPASWSLPSEKIVTPEQVRSILAAARAKSERDYVFFALAANTGLRLSEVGHIMRDDVLDGQIIVTRRKKKHLRPSTIDVGNELNAVLKTWCAGIDMGYIFPGKSAPCFIRHRNRDREQFCIGGHASLRCIQKHWEQAIEEVGLKVRGRGIHSLRHTAITSFYRKTRDLRAAQLFAGHSSSVITERYASVLEMKEMIQSIEPVL